MTPAPVTFDVNVFVDAVAHGVDDFHAWPSPPPIRGNPAANAVGIINDGREFALWTSPHILRNVVTVLTDRDGYDVGLEVAEEYITVIVEMAESSGGGVVDPEETIGYCLDHEDNRILECASTSGSLLIISADGDLTSMSPWRGIPIVTVRDFVGRVDVSRRRRR